jgi:hypothetical protein
VIVVEVTMPATLPEVNDTGERRSQAKDGGNRQRAAHRSPTVWQIEALPLTPALAGIPSSLLAPT